jgi:MFS transporter, PAT family, beta-lactamase induction signal transducer AmpG
MAVLMLVGLAATWAAPKPEAPPQTPRTLVAAVRDPLVEYFSRNGAWLLLLLIVLYKLGDAFAGSLTTAFLLRGAGFSLTEVGVVNKGLGVAATIAGALAGGALMIKLRLYRALLVFGLLQAATNLGFMLLAVSGKSYPLMVSVIAAENLCGGMGTIAFVALLMAMCDRRFSATQYALLSALASLGRVYVGPAAGFMVDAWGWPAFFFFTFLIALPGVAMLWWMRARIDALEAKPG